MPQSADLPAGWAGREPPSMGPMTHGFSALGDAAHSAAGTISALAADAVQAPHRLGHAVDLLTANGQLGTLWQVVLPFAGLLLAAVAAALAVHRLLAGHRRALAALAPSDPAQFARGLLKSLIVDAAPVASYAVLAGGGTFLLFWERGLVFSGTEPSGP